MPLHAWAVNWKWRIGIIGRNPAIIFTFWSSDLEHHINNNFSFQDGKKLDVRTVHCRAVRAKDGQGFSCISDQ